MAPPVVIDCDPGIDDSMALLVAIRAAKEGLWDLKAVTIVQGNTTVDNACTNALRVLEVAKFRVDVHRGCAYPMVIRTQRYEETPFHGHDGFGDVDYPQPKDRSCYKEDVHAVDRLIQLSKEYEGELTVIALGPLTNIAMAMKKDEHFAGRIKQFHIMGGNTQGIGNYISCAEFNFWGDPEAAYVVLDLVKQPIYLTPWELCFLKYITPMEWRKEVLAKIESAEAYLLNTAEHRHIFAEKPINEKMQKYGYFMCDQISVAAALKPDLITRIHTCYASVELAGRDTRGQMVIDHREQKNREPNLHIIEELDKEQLLKLMQWGLYCPQTQVEFNN